MTSHTAAAKPVRVWVGAMRLRTLPLAASCVLCGSALALLEGQFNATVAGLALLTTLLLQVLSNLANDYGDYQNGADSAARIGPQRAVQSGAITPVAMKRAVVVLGAMCLISGIGLLLSAKQVEAHWRWAMLVLGLGAIAAAITYTAGNKPYGYRGLGDLSVFLFFGVVGVLGTVLLQTGNLSKWHLLPAAGLGFLSAGVLNLNNMRDRVPDEAAGKRSLAVTLGPGGARRYHAALIIGGLACYLAFLFRVSSWLEAALTLPACALLLAHLVSVLRIREARLYDGHLPKLAMGTFLLNVLFFIAIASGCM